MENIKDEQLTKFWDELRGDSTGNVADTPSGEEIIGQIKQCAERGVQNNITTEQFFTHIREQFCPMLNIDPHAKENIEVCRLMEYLLHEDANIDLGDIQASLTTLQLQAGTNLPVKGIETLAKVINTISDICPRVDTK